MLDLTLIEILASEVLRLVSMIHIGFAAALVMVLLASVLCCGFERLKERKATLLAAAAILAGTSQLPAQVSSPDSVPTIEPTFTRVFGSDSLNVRMPAISPDGRWIAFAHSEDRAEAQNLWIVSAEGGQPMRLTEGPHYDDAPIWFPTSDRIAFRSDRPGPGTFVMTLPVDPDTGRPTAPSRQVTLNECFAWFDVSRDGKWIAYITRNDTARALEIVPATGGAARTVVLTDTSIPWWSADGSSLYYLLSRVDTPLEALMRVSVDGGLPDTVFTWPGRSWVFKRDDGEFVLRAIDALVLRGTPNGPAQPPEYDLATIEGRSLGRLTLPRRMRLAPFTALGSEVLAVMRDEVAPLTVLPIGGGPARRLNEARATDHPLGWTSNGQRVLFSTALDGQEMLLFSTISGGPMHQVRFPEPTLTRFSPVLSADGRHILYAAPQGDSEASTLKVLDIEHGRSRVITHDHLSARWPVGVVGAGGTWHRDGEDFVYLERQGDRYALRASPAEGPSRLLWAFDPAEIPGHIAVHGERIAFTRRATKESSLFIAVAGEQEVRRVVTRPGGLHDNSAWSPDGRWLAVDYVPPGAEENDTDVLVVEVTPSGEVVGEPRIVDAGAKWWWSLQWLPDSRGFLVVGTTATDGDVWLISLERGSRPVPLTRDDPYSVWDFILSPDGRHIAYSSTIPRGSSIWRVDLGETVTRGR